MTRKRTTLPTQPAKTTPRRRAAPPAVPATHPNATPHETSRRRKPVAAPSAPATTLKVPAPALQPVVGDVGLAPPVLVTARPASKQAQLIALLRSTAGADIAQMIAVTGWQAHSVRGAISGVLRKKLGLTVVSQADAAGIRRYRIVDTASA